MISSQCWLISGFEIWGGGGGGGGKSTYFEIWGGGAKAHILKSGGGGPGSSAYVDQIGNGITCTHSNNTKIATEAGCALCSENLQQIKCKLDPQCSYRSKKQQRASLGVDLSVSSVI